MPPGRQARSPDVRSTLGGLGGIFVWNGIEGLEIKQSFTVARPLTEVWTLFQDVPVVAAPWTYSTYRGNPRSKVS